MAGVQEAGLDAADGAEHPAMLAPDLPLELVPLAGNHMEDLLQTCSRGDGGAQRGPGGDKHVHSFHKNSLSSSLQHPVACSEPWPSGGAEGAAAFIPGAAASLLALLILEKTVSSCDSFLPLALLSLPPSWLHSYEFSSEGHSANPNINNEWSRAGVQPPVCVSVCMNTSVRAADCT